MDKTTGIVICSVASLGAFILILRGFSKQGRGVLKLPFGIRLKAEGRSEPAAKTGASLEDAEAEGDIRVKDATGQGATGRKLKSRRNIEVSNTGGSPPKT